MLIEASATMRYAIQSFCEDSDHEIDFFSSYTEASEALSSQYNTFDNDYHCIVMGWPNIRKTNGGENFVKLLGAPDFHDLPVIVLSQDMRADTRAWVAERNHTVLVPWKEYQTVLDLINKLIGHDISQEIEVFPSKFPNGDINILVADDSPSIRYALSDLLNLHGYRVQVVDTAVKAFEVASNSDFDIAIIDFYLQESTGDELCRKLLTDDKTQHMTCAILTGTYSDHIIRRSLRAGAVECMFKNESSELLLARIDAISHLIRGKKQLKDDRNRLDAILDSVKDGVYGVDKKGYVIFINSRAKTMLGYEQGVDLVGKLAHDLFHHSDASGKPILPEASEIHRAYAHEITSQNMDGTFFDHQGKAIDVAYTIRPFMLNNKASGSIIEFSPKVESTVVDPKTWNNLTYDALTGLMNKRYFESFLNNEILRAPRSQSNASLLLLDLEYCARGSKQVRTVKPVSIEKSTSMVRTAAKILTQSFRTTDLIGYLGNGQFGIIISHKQPEDALLVTRKLVQKIYAVSLQMKFTRLICSAALINIQNCAPNDAGQLLSKAQLGCQIAKNKRLYHVFIGEHNQIVSCLPTSRNGRQHQSDQHLKANAHL